MVHIKEYRIPLPFTVDEFECGHVYMSAKAANNASLVNKSGVEIIERRIEPNTKVFDVCPFEFSSRSETLDCSYHHRILTASTSIPTWAKTILGGRSALHIDEKSWQAFPFIKTVYSVPLLGERFSLVVLSNHSDNLKLKNALNLSKSDLKKRRVDWIDIAEKGDPSEYLENEDPSLFQSVKTNRGPLHTNWPFTSNPVMCAYKCVRVESQFWGINNKVEQFTQDILRNVYLKCHRQSFCWIDEWIDLTLEDISKINWEEINTEDTTLSTSTNIKSKLDRFKPSGWLKARL